MTQTLFSRVPVDQPCKETEGQGIGGGTEVFSLKIRAISKYYPSNIIGDELLLNFGAKFQRSFVKFKIAMATFPYFSVSRWRRSFKMP